MYFEYKSCSFFSLGVCRIFICYNCCCGIKVMKMRKNSVSAVLSRRVACFCGSSG
jgi:hypothetical protein